MSNVLKFPAKPETFQMQCDCGSSRFNVFVKPMQDGYYSYDALRCADCRSLMYPVEPE